MGYIMDLRGILGHRPIIMAGAGAVLINGNNEILLQKRRDNGMWDYPAGSMELGESFEECARREVLEETGLLCGRLEYLTDLSGKDSFTEYPNGDQGYIAGIIYICRDFSGEMKIQEEEVITQGFFPADALPDNPNPVKRRIFERVREYLRSDAR